MLENYSITLSQPDRFGQYRVCAKWAGIEYLDFFNPANEWRRRTFAENALSTFGWTDATADQVGNVMRDVLAELSQIERAQAPDEERLNMRAAKGMKSSQLSWLWPGRIAIGKLCVIAGDPGLGKSLLTVDIAAHASRGAHWPDESGFSPVASVCLMSAEDDFADTILPRLVAADADIDRIFGITGVSSGSGETASERLVDIVTDLSKLRASLEELPEPRLLVIDPISNFLGVAGENANAEVRKLLQPVMKLAQETKTAIVLVSHMRKAKGSSLHRIIGSIAFAAYARNAFVVQRVKDATGQERRIVPVKSNLGGAKTAIRFRVEEHPEHGQPRIVWGAEEPHDGLEIPNEPMGRPSRVPADCVRQLDERLAQGPAMFRELQELVQNEVPCERTLYRLVKERYQWLDEKAGRCKLIGLKQTKEE